MALLEKSLVVKRSKLPGAGKGLFTTQFIAKGSRIIEYKGRATSWKEVKHDNGANGYLYYINRNHVIDARHEKRAKARFANDAAGLSRVKGLKNNSVYEIEDDKCFIVSTRDITAGEEIFVSYTKEYWDCIRYNIKIGRHHK